MKNLNVLNSTSDFNGNNIVNILIVLGLHENGIATVRKFDKITKKHYNSGYWWDIWQNIEKEIKDKYVFKYHYTDPKKYTDYNQICRDIHSGKYDLCLGLFRRTKERERIINYCAPVLIDANAVLYKSNNNNLFNVFRVMKKIWKQFLFLLILGIVFGLFLKFFDKSRTKFMTKWEKNNFLIRSIITGISTVFGEMGYLSERSTPTIKSAIITTIMIMIAFIIILYIQGEVTRILVNEEIGGVNKRNIRSKPIVGEKGYAVLKALEDQGATIERKKKNIDDIIKLYLKNPGKYLGIGMTYTESIPFSQIYGLKAALGFGFYSASGVISEKFHHLREDINYHIAKLRNRGKLQRICHSYYGDSENVPTCTLR